MSFTPVVVAASFLAVPGHAPDLAALAAGATSGPERDAARAVAALREAGPAGLQALLAQGGDHDARWHAAVDAVAAQKDADTSGLYWYTDLDRAVAAARAGGRPILSLRLLGRLDQEASCANSRFFRSVLYANEDVARALRENFVLHWQSVRPVPRVTIDMGDGRTLAGTVTGNSIHYVLDSSGRVVDGLPGLYGPQAFVRLLTEAARTAREAASRDGADWARVVARRHREALKAAGGDAPGVPVPVSAPGGSPGARAAGRLAMTKAAVEMPLLRGVTPVQSNLAQALETREVMRRAPSFRAECRLDAKSRAVVVRKQRQWLRAAGLEAPAPEQIVEQVERALAADTARNETLLHPRLRAWFADGSAGPSVDALNQRVYAELFLTPSSDPWLGLVDGGAFAALDPQAARQQALQPRH